MRTGGNENALGRFEARMNNTVISQFVRGIIATMNGENMTVYFKELVAQMAVMRKERLTTISYKVKSKIRTLTLIRSSVAMLILLIVIGVGMVQMIKF